MVSIKEIIIYFKDSKNCFVFWDLPSCMPRPFGGAVADEGGQTKNLGKTLSKVF